MPRRYRVEPVPLTADESCHEEGCTKQAVVCYLVVCNCTPECRSVVIGAAACTDHRQTAFDKAQDYVTDEGDICEGCPVGLTAAEFGSDEKPACKACGATRVFSDNEMAQLFGAAL